jgi:hypothetical protein
LINALKIYQKTLKGFKQASKELSLSIVTKKLPPLSQGETNEGDCFMINNLFATYA